MIRAAASLAVVLLIGYALVLLMFRTRPNRNAGLSFALSLGLGFGFLAEYCLLSLMLTRHLDFTFAYVASVLAAGGILYEKKRARSLNLLRLVPFSGVLRGKGHQKGPASQKIMAGAAAIIVAIIVSIVAFNLLARPMYHYDSRAIWGLKAKILFEERTIFSDSVEDISRNHPHPRYPLLLPIASAWVFQNMGKADDRRVRLLFLAYFVGLILAAYQLQRTHAGHTAAFVSVAALLSAPLLYAGMRSGGSSGHADIIVAFYITMSVLAITLWMKEKKRAFMIAGALFAAFTALTKNEGLVFAVNLFLTTAFFSLAWGKSNETAGAGKPALFAWLKTNSSKLCDLAVYVLVVAAVLFPWLSVRSGLPRFLDEDYLRHLNYEEVSAGLHRLPEIIRILGAELLNIRNWGIIWILIAASLLGAGKTWKKERFFILSLIALQMASYLAIFVITPGNLAGQMKVSLSRLLLHVLPLGAMLLSLQIGGREEISTGGTLPDVPQ